MANPSFDHDLTPAVSTPQAIKTQVEFALLDRLHLEDDSPYAWQSLEASPKLDGELDENDVALGWSEAAIEAGSARFFSALDNLWEQTNQEATEGVPSLQRLRDRFGARIPTDLLNTIIERATTMVGQAEQSGQAAIAQLIHCVDGSIPGWSADDWRTIARPYAFAMRDQSKRSGVSDDVAWDDLSKIERAKLSLEVTLAALEELQLDDYAGDD